MQSKGYHNECFDATYYGGGFSFNSLTLGSDKRMGMKNQIKHLIKDLPRNCDNIGKSRDCVFTLQGKLKKQGARCICLLVGFTREQRLSS